MAILDDRQHLTIWVVLDMFSVDRQQALIRQIVEEVSSQAPAGWSKMEFIFMAAGRTLRYELEIDIDAVPNIYPPANVMELRNSMYVPGRGTWFTMYLTVTSFGEVNTAFDYEGRPPHGVSLGAALEEDLLLYPRDVVPDWIQDALAELHRSSTSEAHSDLGGRVPSVIDHVIKIPRPMQDVRDSEHNAEFASAAKDFQPEEPGMCYVKILRIEESGSGPICVFVEIDADGYESRKVEIFPDGQVDSASLFFEGERTRLREDLALPLTETVSPEEFTFEAITPVDFQTEWLAVEGMD